MFPIHITLRNMSVSLPRKLICGAWSVSGKGLKKYERSKSITNFFSQSVGTSEATLICRVWEQMC